MSKEIVNIYEMVISTLDYAIDTAKIAKKYDGTIDDIINDLENAKDRRQKDLERMKEKSNE